MIKETEKNIINAIARIVFGAMLAIFAWIHFVSQAFIDRIFATLPVVCPLRLITGLRCAFCGMTHAWVAIARGDFSLAVHENLLSIPLLLITVVGVMGASFGYQIKMTHTEKKWGFISSTFLLVSYAIFRNMN